MFPPGEERHAVLLSHCSLLGCTFGDGSVEQCALHGFLHEEASCP